jgi:hypothetical protein
MTYTKEEVREAFYAGFKASGEGFNAEYPFAHNKTMIRENLTLTERLEEFMDDS